MRNTTGIGLVVIGALLMRARHRRAARIGEMRKPGDIIPTDAPLDSNERKILSWRISELLRVGFDELTANALAISADWRLAVDAVEKGCDHRTAVRIVL